MAADRPEAGAIHCAKRSFNDLVLKRDVSSMSRCTGARKILVSHKLALNG